jgi:hypothetical protein
VESDRLAWRVLYQRRRFEDRAPLAARRLPACVAPDPARDERLDESLRPDAVAPAVEAALRAAEGRDGEAGRRGLRAVAAPYLARATAPWDRELAAIEARSVTPSIEFPQRLEGERDPARRGSVWREWADLVARLEQPRRERVSACEAAAAAAGADSLAAFGAALHPRPPASTCAEFERGAIAPLDDVVEAAARDRYGPLPSDGPDRAARLPLPGLFPEHTDRFDAKLTRRVIEECSRVFPVVRGVRPAIVAAESTPDLGGAFPLATREGALVVSGWPGPGGLRDALGALGSCQRGAFLGGGENPAAVVLGDPAFAVAPRVLFRRLVLSDVFLQWAGVDVGRGFATDARLEEAVATREAWSYLYLASSGGEPEPTEVDRVFRRCSGRPPDPGRRARVLERDLSGAAELRGTVLALLQEERLLSRFGRRWFLDRSAGTWLAGCWEAEAGETVENVSEQCDLGTIEPTPILDRCRP